MDKIDEKLCNKFNTTNVPFVMKKKLTVKLVILFGVRKKEKIYEIENIIQNQLKDNDMKVNNYYNIT